MTSFEAAIAALGNLGDSSVWSLIVTVMGDRVGDGGVIAGPVLAEVLEPIGVKPEALRVALHRLRKDGWIASNKTGRTSAHRLTDFGMAETRVAALRIYQRQVELPANWYLLVGEKDANHPTDESILYLGRGVYLGSGIAPVQDAFLVIQGNRPTLPKWLKSQLGWDELAVSYAQLAEALGIVNDALRANLQLLPNQVATLRTLVVHHWRRNLLRHQDLPLGFFPEGWQGEDCRELVMALLDRLPLEANTKPASKPPRPRG